MPVGLAGVAVWAAQRDIGVFNGWQASPLIVVPVTLIVMDFALWLQHWITHKVSVLWRLHRVHHADPDFDITTTLRFHPVEIVLSLFYKAAWVVVLGAPALVVFWFEVLVNAFAQFNHANIRLPGSLDRVLRWFIVTPDMHRVHHSVRYDESLKNYGFCLSLWDRLFRTYKAQPDDGHLGMRIGQPDWRSVRDQRVDQLLIQPLSQPKEPVA